MSESFEKGKVRKQIPIFCKQGRNSGKQTGEVIYRDGSLPYYSVDKRFKKDHIYHIKKYAQYFQISVHILEELEKLGVVNVVANIIGLEKKSFYIVVPLKDFLKSKIETKFDDKQKVVYYSEYPRIYSDQKLLEGL